MKILFSSCGLLVTLSPIVIPIWLRGGRFGAVFDLQNHCLNFREILFAIVAINSITAVDILEILVEAKKTNISNAGLGVAFLVLLVALFYGLIQIGQYALIRESGLEKLVPRKLKWDWLVIFFSVLGSLGIKWFGG